MQLLTTSTSEPNKGTSNKAGKENGTVYSAYMCDKCLFTYNSTLESPRTNDRPGKTQDINSGGRQNPERKGKKTKLMVTEVTDSDASDGGKGMYSHQ